MKEFFGKYRFMRIALRVVYIILLFFALQKFELMTIILLMIIYYSLSMMISFLDMKEHRDLTDVLINKCDAIKFINDYSIIFNRQFKSANRTIMVVSNMALAYSQVGDYQSAIRIMEDYFAVNGISLKKKYLYLEIHFFNNLAAYYISEGDIKKGREALNRARWSQQQNRNPRTYFMFYKHIMENEYSLLQLNHRYKEALQYFETVLPMSSNLFDEVSTHFNLSRIHLALGNVEKQREHLEFVARYGNTLAIASEARTLLQEM